MKYLNIVILFILITMLNACVSQIPKPIDRSESEYINFKGLIVFKLPQGEDWYEVINRNGTVAYGKKLESAKHTFIASAHISEFSIKFSSPEDFLSFVKKSRMQSTPQDRFNIIEYKEVLDKSRYDFCTKYILKVEEKEKGILESNGYSCLHPKYPELGVTIEYSERTKDLHVSEKVLIEGKNFINSLELRE